MHVFGTFYGRGGEETVNLTIDDDKIQELVEANANDEDWFERLAEENDTGDESIGYYTAMTALTDKIRDNNYLVCPFSLIDEEFTYGCAMTEDGARIAFTKTEG